MNKIRIKYSWNTDSQPSAMRRTIQNATLIYILVFQCGFIYRDKSLNNLWNICVSQYLLQYYLFLKYIHK